MIDTERPGDPAPARTTATLRVVGEAGDLGWIIGSHATVYADEYGWDSSFEVLVARIVTDFAEHHDDHRERAWIAELDGTRVGCVMLVDDGAGVARLRVLLVHPAARGHGVGRALVSACLAFARRSGYHRVELWTNDVLTAALRLYREQGFALVGEERHRSFGHDLVGQTWARDL